MGNRIEGVMQNYDDFKNMYLEKQNDDMEVIESKINLGISTMNDLVSNIFKLEFKQICEQMGNYSLTISDNVTTLTNYATNDTSHVNNNEKVNNGIIESPITTQNTDIINNIAYTMPAYFDTFPSMLSH